MQTITVHTKAHPAASYPIFIGSALLQKPEKWLPAGFEHYVIITDHSVSKHYGETLLHGLKAQKLPAFLLAFQAGEHQKNSDTWQSLADKLCAIGASRRTLLLALGGGVVGDMTGFLAATYMRGVPYLALPTSLLAMVDSSVGGKTAIDTKQGKNLLGAFYQPQAVISDVDCLRTLSITQRICGLVEAIKIFITCDAAYLHTLMQKDCATLLEDQDVIVDMIAQAVRLKADIVACDEQEKKGQRIICNFGHTIGHALEHASAYKLPHGIAVGLGIRVEIHIAHLLGLLSAQDCHKISKILTKIGVRLSDLDAFDAQSVLAATRSDKKNWGGQVRYVLLKALGQVFVAAGNYSHPVDDSLAERAFLAVKQGVSYER